MIFRKILVTLLLLSASLPALCQDYKNDFKTLIDKKDTAGQRKLLDKWQQKAPKDPELFISWFNYYVGKGATEIVMIDSDQKDNRSELAQQQDLVLNDTASDDGDFVGSIIKYDPAYTKTAFEYIDKGIAAFPNRLDMRFGKVYLLGQTEQYDLFVAEIIKTIDYYFKKKNAWVWSDGKPAENPKTFMLTIIQDYMSTLFEAGEGQADHIKMVAEEVLKYYPQHVESMTNLAIAYAMKTNTTKAVELLLKAEKLSPKDCVVLNNLAYIYATNNNKPKAVAYYQKVIKYGDEKDKKMAADQLKELGNTPK